MASTQLSPQPLPRLETLARAKRKTLAGSLRSRACTRINFGANQLLGPRTTKHNTNTPTPTHKLPSHQTQQTPLTLPFSFTSLLTATTASRINSSYLTSRHQHTQLVYHSQHQHNLYYCTPSHSVHNIFILTLNNIMQSCVFISIAIFCLGSYFESPL